MRARLRLSVACLVLAVSSKAAPASRSGSAGWAPIGPDGGTVAELLADPANPDIGLAITGILDANLYKTTDGGASWNELPLGLDAAKLGIEPLTAAFTPGNSSHILVGANFDGAYRSTDGGRSWAPSNSGLPSFASVSVLAASPSQPSTFFANCEYKGLFRSTDEGRSWKSAGGGLPTDVPGDVTAIAFDPMSLAVAYCLTAGDGLFKTTDGGGVWKPLQPGVDGFTAPYGSHLFLDPHDGTLYLAGTISFYPAVLRSVDGGATWTTFFTSELASDCPRGLSSAAFGESPGQIVAGSDLGIAVTSNAGATWSCSTSGLELAGVSALSASGGTLFAGGDGVYRSDDHGAHWRWAGTGIRGPGRGVPSNQDLAISPSNPSIVYVGASGLSKSTDGGGTWRHIAWPAFLENLAGRSEMTSLAVSPTDPNRLLIGTQAGLGVSTDGGATFASVDAPALACETGGGIGVPGFLLASSPSSPSLIYAFGQTELCNLVTTKSTDGGLHWTTFSNSLSSQVPAAGMYDLAADPSHSGWLYISVASSGADRGIYKSTSGGSTWTPANAGLPAGGAYRLAIASDGTVLAASSSGLGLFRSSDAGASWASTSGIVASDASIPAIASVRIAPGDPTRAYAGTFPLTFDAKSPGVFESRDGGRTWALAGTDLDGESIEALACDLSGNFVLAETGDGIFRLETGSVSGVVETGPIRVHGRP